MGPFFSYQLSVQFNSSTIQQLNIYLIQYTQFSFLGAGSG